MFLVWDVVDYFVGVDGDDVRGRVGGANEVIVVFVRKVIVLEIVVVVEKLECGGVDGDLIDCCG